MRSLLIPSDERAVRRRATAYVAVLGVSMMVMTIGMSALVALRVQRKSALVSAEVVKARYMSQSAAELALYTIANDSSWRSTYTHDVWSAKQSSAGMDYNFKFVDQVDTDLADDGYDPVRAFAKAEVGQAVRIYSVLLSARTPDNLLKNGAMEAGKSGWVCTAYASSNVCEIDHLSDAPFAGKWYFYIKNRDFTYAGPTQDIVKTIKSGTEYYAEAQVKMKDTLNAIRFTMKLTATGSGESWHSTGWTIANTSWVKVGGTVTPSWTGDLTEAVIYIEGNNGTPDFMVDNALLVEGDGPPSAEMAVVPGTWRRESAE